MIVARFSLALDNKTQVKLIFKATHTAVSNVKWNEVCAYSILCHWLSNLDLFWCCANLSVANTYLKGIADGKKKSQLPFGISFGTDCSNFVHIDWIQWT